MTNIQTIIATEHDGLNVRTLVINCEILEDDPDFDLRNAVTSAIRNYLRTPDGKRVYEYNCRNFNWADFETNVPNELCERYGFRKMSTMLGDIEVYWDEHLVNDNDFDEFWNKEE